MSLRSSRSSSGIEGARYSLRRAATEGSSRRLQSLIQQLNSNQPRHLGTVIDVMCEEIYASNLEEVRDTTLSRARNAHLRFVPFERFKKAGLIPRFGSQTNFVHPEVPEACNMCLCSPYEDFDRSTTAFIFVSHRWLRPRQGPAGHPDDFDHQKHKLIVEACERLRGPRAPIAEHMQIALWVEYVALHISSQPPPRPACERTRILRLLPSWPLTVPTPRTVAPDGACPTAASPASIRTHPLLKSWRKG